MEHPNWQRLSEFVDGDLPPETARETETHLRACAACRAEAEGIRSLLSRAAELAGGPGPERDLWPAIRAELPRVVRRGSDDETASRSRRPWRGFREAMAAGVALALLVAGSRIHPRNPMPGSGESASVASSSGTPLAEMIPPLVFGLERESQGTGRTLTTAFKAERRAPSTELQALDEGLRVLDQAIGETLKALEKDPENVALLRRVAGYYRLRLEILDREALGGGPA